MQDGQQIGAYRYSDNSYLILKDGVWGPPTVPPIALPQAKKGCTCPDGTTCHCATSPTKPTKPVHIVDENGVWWIPADPSDPDQRQWYSRGESDPSWHRDEGKATVRVAPFTCQCPATGNKDGSRGPNNCACHDLDLQCGCHKNAGTVFTAIPATKAVPAVKATARPMMMPAPRSSPVMQPAGMAPPAMRMSRSAGKC